MVGKPVIFPEEQKVSNVLTAYSRFQMTLFKRDRSFKVSLQVL